MSMDGTGVRPSSPAASGGRSASEAWDKVRIADFAIRQRDVSREVAHIDAEVEVEAARSRSGAHHRQLRFDWRYQHGIADRLPRQPRIFTPGATLSIFPIEIRSPSSGIPPAMAISLLYDFTAPRLTAGSASRPAHDVRPAYAPSCSIAIPTSGADLSNWS